MSEDKQQPERPSEISFPELTASIENDKGQIVSLRESLEIRDNQQTREQQKND